MTGISVKRGLEGGDEVIMGWKKERSKEGRKEKNNGNADAEREAFMSPHTVILFILFIQL